MTDAVEKTVGRLLEAGWSRERVIADVVIDGGTGTGTGTGGRGVLDRQKAAAALGLADRPSPEAVRSWVRAELIHAIDFGMHRQQLVRMTEDEVRAEFEAALAELRK